MENLVILVKLNSSAASVKSAIGYVQKSCKEETQQYYTTSPKDEKTIQDLLDSETLQLPQNCKIVFIEYRWGKKVYIKKIYVGNATRVEKGNPSLKLYYQILEEINSPLVIDNFMKFSNLRIPEDFPDDAHISIEDSAALIKQLDYAINRPYNKMLQNQTYIPNTAESLLSEFAQKNEYCYRLYNAIPSSKPPAEYQRDYDRIVQSKSFRRMVDKAQIFTSSKGDHYRTRMTHTLCVVQIARSIALELQMNIPLVEAIALGHDLGHTPFGHQGERTLNQRARKHGVTGFKHNYQSLNVASVLEEEYIEFSGLDLSTQVLEGMWKHTRIRKANGTPLYCDLDDFLPYDASPEFKEMLHPNEDYCATIEGQIVSIADEIAQRSHDLDDALSAKLLSVNGLLEILSLKKLTSLKDEIRNLRESMKTAANNQRIFISEEELLASRISARVTNYFIEDVVNSFKKSFLQSLKELQEVRSYFAEHHCVDRIVIAFSDEGQMFNDYLNTIVTKLVINSAEVATFDDKASRIVSTLFDLYYNNPRLLHEGTLQRIYIKMRQKSDQVIHFQDGDIDLVRDEWSRIKNPENSMRIRDLREEFPEIVFDDLYCGDRNKEMEDLTKLVQEDPTKIAKIENYQEACFNEYMEKKKILVRSICDFISGMTDTYATNEYRKLMG